MTTLPKHYPQRRQGRVDSAQKDTLAKTTAVTEQTKGSDGVSEEERRLRQFDLDQRYGPCMGVSRVER